jgi:hypothetical protein
VNDWNELRIKNEGSITKKISEEEDNLHGSMLDKIQLIETSKKNATFEDE